MKLYGFPPSPNTWKVRALAAHLGADAVLVAPEVVGTVAQVHVGSFQVSRIVPNIAAGR